MKINRIILILFAYIVQINILYCQKFQVTPDGMRDYDNVRNDYVIINLNNRPANIIYSNILRYVNKTYSDPISMIKGTYPNEFVSYQVIHKNFIKIAYNVHNVPINIEYMLKIDIKDNRIKIQICDVIMYEQDHKEKYYVFFKQKTFTDIYFIYNRRGGLMRPVDKLTIEDYFNGQIKTLLYYINDYDYLDW